MSAETTKQVINLEDGIQIEEAQSFFATLWENNQDLILYAGKQLFLAIIIIIAMIVFSKLTSSLIHRIAVHAKWCDDALERILKQISRYAIAFVGLLIVLELFGVNTASLLTLLGAAGLAIGLALKDTLSNMAAGFVLLIMRPYNPGDYIECGGVSGTITKMGLFTSILTTPDGLFISVPNNALWGSPIKNYSRNTVRRVDITVKVSYTDDIEKGVEVLSGLLNNNPLILKDPAPQVLVAELAESSVNLQLRFWAENANYWTAFWEVKNKLKVTLEDAGLNIPLPQRVITFTNAAPKEK